MKTVLSLVVLLSVAVTVDGAAFNLGQTCAAAADTCTANAATVTCTAALETCSCATGYKAEGLNTCAREAGLSCTLGTSTCVINSLCTSSVCTCFDGYTASNGRCKPSGASHVMYSLTALLLSALLSLHYCTQ